MKVKSAKKTKAPREWSVGDARDLHHIAEWSMGYFDINTDGNVVVRPRKMATPDARLRA